MFVLLIALHWRRSMFEGKAGLVRGFRLVLMAYGVLMALEVVIIESVLNAANTVGVVGIAGFVPASFVYFFGDVRARIWRRASST